MRWITVLKLTHTHTHTHTYTHTHTHKHYACCMPLGLLAHSLVYSVYTPGRHRIGEFIMAISLAQTVH